MFPLRYDDRELVVRRVPSHECKLREMLARIEQLMVIIGRTEISDKLIVGYIQAWPSKPRMRSNLAARVRLAIKNPDTSAASIIRRNFFGNDT